MSKNLEERIEELMGGDEFGGLRELIKLGRSATPRLIKILVEDSDLLMRKRAAFALGRIRDKTAITPLIKSLADENPTVVISVIDALAILGIRDRTKVAQNLSPLLKNSEPSIRMHTVKALSNLHVRDSLPYLEEIINKDENVLIRKEAAEAMRKIRKRKRARQQHRR